MHTGSCITSFQQTAGSYTSLTSPFIFFICFAFNINTNIIIIVIICGTGTAIISSQTEFHVQINIIRNSFRANRARWIIGSSFTILDLLLKNIKLFQKSNFYKKISALRFEMKTYLKSGTSIIFYALISIPTIL